MKYGDSWRQGRRAFHQHFREQVVHQYHERVTKGVRKLLLALLDDPDTFADHLRQYVYPIQ